MNAPTVIVLYLCMGVFFYIGIDSMMRLARKFLKDDDDLLEKIDKYFEYNKEGGIINQVVLTWPLYVVAAVVEVMIKLKNIVTGSAYEE